jgi:hypothetical protein
VAELRRDSGSIVFSVVADVIPLLPAQSSTAITHRILIPIYWLLGSGRLGWPCPTRDDGQIRCEVNDVAMIEPTSQSKHAEIFWRLLHAASKYFLVKNGCPRIGCRAGVCYNLQRLCSLRGSLTGEEMNGGQVRGALVDAAYGTSREVDWSVNINDPSVFRQV